MDQQTSNRRINREINFPLNEQQNLQILYDLDSTMDSLQEKAVLDARINQLTTFVMERIQQSDQKFDQMMKWMRQSDQKFDQMMKWMQEHGKRMEEQERRMQQSGQRMDRIMNWMQEHDQRMYHHERRMQQSGQRMDRIMNWMQEHDQRMDRIMNWMQEHDQRMYQHERRVERQVHHPNLYLHTATHLNPPSQVNFWSPPRPHITMRNQPLHGTLSSISTIPFNSNPMTPITVSTRPSTTFTPISPFTFSGYKSQ